MNAVANWLGIEFTAKLNRYMLLIELLVLAAFVVLGLHSLYVGGAGAGHLTLLPWYDPAVFSVADGGGSDLDRRAVLSRVRRNLHAGGGESRRR